MSGIAVEVRDLHKAFGDTMVLRGLSFAVTQGESFALLGANGAGKTTTLQCIEQLTHPDGGSVRVTGRLGVQLQNEALPKTIHPEEAVHLFSVWHGSAPDKRMVEALGVPALYGRQYGTLSVGQKRALHLALALSGDPDIVVLDEPTAGLDVMARKALCEVLGELRLRCCTILIASHDMHEVETLADRAVILKDGRCAWEGTPGHLATNAKGEHKISIRTARGTIELWTSNIAADLIAQLEQLRRDHTKVYEVTTAHVSLTEELLRTLEDAS